MPQIIGLGQLTITDTNDGLSAVLSNEGMSLPADKDGVVSSYTGASTTMFIYLGGVDDSANWTVTATPSSGVNGSFGTGVALRTYTISSLTLNSAYVDLTATKPLFPTITKRFSLSISKAGDKGEPGTGTPGAEGLSSVKAYCASSTASTTTAPPQTKGRSTLPLANSGGLIGSWVSVTPVLSSSQRLWVSDGQYNPATDYITWSVPYWASLKVGSLEAAAVDTGNLNVSGTLSTTNGNFSVNNLGQIEAKALTLRDAAGTVILSSGSALNPDFAASGTKNSEATFSPVKVWEFRNTLESWTLTGGPAPTLNVDSVTIGSNTSDPQFISPTISLNGAMYDKIRIRLRRTAGTPGSSGWQGQIYYITSGTPSAYSSSYTKKLTTDPTIGNSDWVIVEWDMSKLDQGGTNWNTSTITRIRMDLGNSATDAFEVDWVALGKYGPVTISELGYTGALDATKGADFNSNVTNIPYASIYNTDDAVALGFNPSFADWTSTRPTGWSGQTPVKETTIKKLGQWALRFNCGSAGSPNTTQYAVNKKVTLPAALPLGTFLSGTFDVYLETVVSGLPGFMIRLWHTASLYKDIEVQPANITGSWQRVPFTARTDAGNQILAIEIYVFGSYSGLDTGHFTGNVVFDNFRFGIYDKSLDNQAITITSDGKLSGAGSGQVTIGGLGYTGDLNATNGADASNLKVPVNSRNLIIANTLPSSAAGYTTFVSAGIPAGTAGGPFYAAGGSSFGNYSPNGRGTVYVSITGTPPANEYIDLYVAPLSSAIPVVAGRRYEFSAAIAVARASGAIYVVAYDSTDTPLATYGGGNVTALSYNTTVDYPRLSYFFTAPANAVKISFRAQLKANGSGATPYLFGSEWYFGEALTNQTVFSKWTPSPDESLSIINSITSDGIISAGSEKSSAFVEWSAISNEQSGLVSQAASLGVDTSDYVAKYNALNTYLNTTLLNFTDITKDTAVTASTYRSNFINYYLAKQTLVNNTAAAAAVAYNSPGSSPVLNDDPMLLNSTVAWIKDPGVSLALNTTATGATGANYFNSTTVDTRVRSARKFPISASKTYMGSASLYANTGNNRRMYIYVNFFDNSGTMIASNGWGGSMSGYIYGDIPAAGVFSTYADQFGAGTSKPIPSNARTCEIGVWFMYSGSGGSSSVNQGAQDIRLVETVALGQLAPAVTTSLNDKLSKSGTDIMSGQVTLQSAQALLVGNTTTGVYMGSGGLVGRKNNATTFSISNGGDAYFGGTLGANVVKAGNIDVGAITASNLAIGASKDNLITDPRFKDKSWWVGNVPDTVVKAADWVSSDGNLWRDAASMYFYPTAFTIYHSRPFYTEPGATYYLEISVYLPPEFTGQFSISCLWPASVYHGMGQPDLYNWADPGSAVAVQHDSNSPKGFRNFNATYTVPQHYYNTSPHFVVQSKVSAGWVEIGDIRVTRCSDSVLIKNGAITANKLSVGQLSAISADVGFLTSRAQSNGYGYGAGTEIQKDQIRIYDEGGNLRVLEGKLY